MRSGFLATGLAVAALTLALLGTGPVPARAQHVHGSGGASAGVVDAAACAQAQTAVDNLVEAAMRRLDAARQSNSPSDMRAAMDELQRALLDIRARLAPCAAAQSAAAAGRPAPDAPSAVDPVCGMTVDSATAPSVEHGGQRYYFCTDAHRAQFSADPRKYIKR